MEKFPGNNHSSFVPEKVTNYKFVSALILAFSVAALSACKQSSPENSEETTRVVVTEPERESVEEEELGLFDARSEDIDYERSDLPELLPELISEFGGVYYMSDFDPGREDIFIIANKHTPVHSDPAVVREIYDIQEEGLNIIHQLRRIGLRHLFAEGVGYGVTFDHETDIPEMGEDPVNALPTYIATGLIDRSYIAAEAIYGDSLNSLGVDNVDDMLDRRNRTRYAYGRVGFFMRSIHLDLLTRFGVDVDESRMNDGSYLNDVSRQLSEIVQHYSEEDLRRVYLDIIDSYPGYLDLIQELAELEYAKIQGRSATFSQNIVDFYEGNTGSSVFSVGAFHVTDLVRDLSDQFNVIVITPRSLDVVNSVEHPTATYSLDDYKNYLINSHAARCGLSQLRPSSRL